jgi:hypothetical protein
MQSNGEKSYHDNMYFPREQIYIKKQRVKRLEGHEFVANERIGHQLRKC